MLERELPFGNTISSSSNTVTLNAERETNTVRCSTYLLVALFGIGSWIAVNGVFSELPVLVNHAPEGKLLPSFITLILQFANMGPVVFALGKRYAKFHEKGAILFILPLGVAACISLCFFWDRTSYIFGKQRSTALLILTFIIALVDCTSSVTFLPFMIMFPCKYMSALYVGENLSSLLPGLFALIQGVDHYKAYNSSQHSAGLRGSYPGMNFGPQWYFGILCILMLTSLFAFLALNFMPTARFHHTLRYTNDSIPYDRLQNEDPLINNEPSYRETSENPTVSKNTVCRLILQAWINMLSNGVIPQVQSFAALPYGASTYHLAVTLSGVVSAFISFLYMRLPTKSSIVIFIWSVLFTLCSIYVIIIALESPHPLLVHQKVGNALLVIVSVVSAICCTYSKLAICCAMRDAGRQHLFYCGIAIQVGSFIGAVIAFPVVNYSGLFK